MEQPVSKMTFPSAFPQDLTDGTTATQSSFCGEGDNVDKDGYRDSTETCSWDSDMDGDFLKDGVS